MTDAEPRNASWAQRDLCEYESGQQEFDVAFRFYVNGVLLNCVGALGVVGNALAVAVLSRPQMRSSINCLLAGLARCDAALSLTSVLLFGLPGVFPYTGALRTYYYLVYPNIAPLVFPLACVAQTVSVYLTLTVTAERFVAVCHPLRARALCTYGRARCCVLAVLALALLYNLPKFWETAVVAVRLRVAGEEVTVYCVQPSSFRTERYVAVYIHWMYLVFMYILPFAALAVLNALIYRQVRRANAERARLSRVQRREIGLATMLLVVVLVFFACNLLPLVTNTLESFSAGPLAQLDPIVKTSNLLVTINSSVNFLIYVIFGEKFKRLFLKMFCARGPPAARDSPDLTHDESFASSGGDRTSVRLHRSYTACSNGGGGARTERRSLHAARSPSPCPVVYYPRAAAAAPLPPAPASAPAPAPATAATQF